jgi:glycerol-3-phosphate dehydrogenase
VKANERTVALLESNSNVGERHGSTAVFNMVVIGTGVVGSTVALECRVAGLEVAIVDSRPFGARAP